MLAIVASISGPVVQVNTRISSHPSSYEIPGKRLNFGEMNEPPFATRTSGEVCVDITSSTVTRTLAALS